MKARRGSVWGVVVFLSLAVFPWGRAGAFDPGEWTEPMPLTEVNSDYDDKAPFLSFDGLRLYFARSSAWRYTEIYEATRATPEEPFGEPSQIAGLNSPYANVDYPWVSRDHLRMYYYSTESSWRRLRMAGRSSTESWWRVGSEIPELNSLGEVANPSLTEDELTIVFSGLDLWDGKGGWDLWMADRPNKDAPFGNVTNLGIVNSGYWDMHPCVTPDGLTLYFASNRNGVFQIFESTRPSRNSRFGPPAHMAVLDIPDASVQYPHLSADGKMFLFGRWKNDESMDICVSYRVDLSVRGVRLVRGGDAGDNPWGSSIYATVQEAIAAATHGDTLSLQPGLYRGPISFLGKAVTIESAADAAVLEAPGDAVVSFRNGEGRNSVLRNVILRGSQVGIWLADSSPTITNVTVADNVLGVEAYGDSDPRISNSIFWGNAESDLYGCQAVYSCIQRGGPGEGNFSEDPLFVAPENGDYHVQSRRGRYWPAQDVWVLDKVSSPCIDAGAPAADFSREPVPNGGRVNVGAHGGTAFAEMSELPVSSDINGDGVADVGDLELFLDLWEQQSQSKPPVGR